MAKQSDNLSDHFGISYDQIARISAKLMASVGREVFDNPDKGGSEQTLIECAQKNYQGSERDIAMFLCSRFGMEHSSNSQKKGPLAMAILIQQAYKFQTVEELEEKLYQRLLKMK